MSYDHIEKHPNPTIFNSSRHDQGVNALHVGVLNRLLVLKAIVLDGPMSRSELAARLGLTKTTLGNIVSELTASQLICETEDRGRGESIALGRRPILLQLSEDAPCILGILINRQGLTGVIANLKGEFLDRRDLSYTGVTCKEDFLDKVHSMIQYLLANTRRNIFAIGVSSIGPIDITSGTILNPANFFGIHDLPIVDILESRYSIPCFLIHDADAGALAEKIYGQERDTKNFLFLSIKNGIAAGYILDDHLYIGNIGQSGEIGHSTIDCHGPQCICGNIGCLELYANTENMNRKIQFMRKAFNLSKYPADSDCSYSFSEILQQAGNNDICAMAALDEFCDYLSAALVNVIRFLDINRIIVGYDSKSNHSILERLLDQKIRSRISFPANYDLIIQHSVFNGDALLYGAIAHIAALVFDGQINFLGGSE